MAGILLETLSNRKLIAYFVALFLIQFGFFFIGGYLAPDPTNVQSLLSNICLNKKADDTIWFARGEKNCPNPISDTHVDMVQVAKENNITDGKQIVFSWRFPLPKEQQVLYMSPLHQNMMAMIRIQMKRYLGHGQDRKKEYPEAVVMDGRLGYRDNKEDGWQEISRSRTMKRFLDCDNEIENRFDKNETEIFDCELLPLFELGSVHHNEYLINVRFPSQDNEDLGELFDLWVYVIHQNGGFTFIWFSLKTLVFPIVTSAMVWYVWKLLQLNRKPNVLERTLLAVGVAITLMNFPIDWLTLWVNMPFMMLYSDIRQGLFYSVLLCFWVIFAGEHMMDSVKRDDLRFYWKQLTAVGVGCVCMFLFDFCERGIQLTNPFFSIWSTKVGANVAFGFIILAGIAACIYFIYLLVTIACVLKNICAKKHVIPSMSKARQKFYKNQIYRFSFLMTLTLLCACMTVVFFIIGQVEEGRWKWGSEDIHYTSAVQTGVYGMWNLYVLTLLILYAPSNKSICPINLVNEPTVTSTDDVVEFSTVPSEVATLTRFLQKTSIE